MLIHPDKSRGQNFLTDKNVLQKIIDAGELKKFDVVLEIGAGTGVLTVELAKRVKKVISFEIDKKLIPVLQENLKDFNNVEIRNADAVPAGEMPAGCKLIANIPYNITSAILEKFLSAKQPPELIVLLVQKEVAERVCAKSGEMSILSVMAQYYGEPKIIARVPPSAFYPVPKVDSAILKIIIKKRWPAVDEKKFFQIVKAGFSQRRKMLKNNLRALADEKKIVAAMREAGIIEKARAQELGVSEWISLTGAFDTLL
ncbi:MAG TPA: ribosomal RNA small subunit methyltransferase A [Candidatus Magasanikbacteria bacterium]|uniref:Ribosomal RNA small subunit methyltransferase A n=1 Tax=Candidatus Magasanikbacteria bacterium GW2011_GWC2_41_17 TaxID=1619048 RepID=A0A0G0XPX9_9BACT|nr:MAG: Ribosomal RNA small subunit methyltransferase A [Candidatus Magasanikbacteria bacterium GW2011_GWC2_41_17]HBV58127.1 ribosomal RNA small subunit methyltransferase A [Candidatus Magasanikbacteria bacterium]